MLNRFFFEEHYLEIKNIFEKYDVDHEKLMIRLFPTGIEVSMYFYFPDKAEVYYEFEEELQRMFLKYSISYNAVRLLNRQVLGQELSIPKEAEPFIKFEKIKLGSSSFFATSSKDAEVEVLAPIPKSVLEIFDATLNCIVEQFNELEENEKQLLTSRLYDIDPDIQSVRNFAYIVDLSENSIGAVFHIIYCALHPQYWDLDDKIISDYRQNLLVNIAKISLGDSQMPYIEQTIAFLKQHAKKFVEEKIPKLPISDQNNQTKLEIIEKAKMRQSTQDDDVAKENSFKEVCKLLIDDTGDIVKCGSGIKEISQNKYLAVPWRELSLTSFAWPPIFQLIKMTPFGHQRKEDDMIKVVRAILYKEQEHCSWTKLPQTLPPWRRVYYYYKLWEQVGILKNIIYSTPPEVIKTRSSSM